MNSNCNIDVALCGRSVYAKVAGLANMGNCMTFQDFATVLLDAGYERVIVDLRQCTGMDSTFLGVLAGMATHIETRRGPLVVVINASPDNVETMESVGLASFLQIRPQTVEVPPLETYPVNDDQVSDRDRIEFIKEAHEKLVAIDRRNQEKFGPVLKLLNGELARKK